MQEANLPLKALDWYSVKISLTLFSHAETLINQYTIPSFFMVTVAVLEYVEPLLDTHHPHHFKANISRSKFVWTVLFVCTVHLN